MQDLKPQRRLPEWFKVPLSTDGKYASVRRRVRTDGLHTVCESAACPNRNECWNAGTAAFLILGDVCTRSCGFCNIRTGVPAALDAAEPDRVAHAVAALGLAYAVITSVTRDDLPDGGAAVFSDTVRAVRRCSPRCRVEVLVPDFRGSRSSLDAVLDAAPDVLNHNIETVPSFYRRVRPQADYGRSLQVLEQASARGAAAKSGLMLGFGEGKDEVRSVMNDLRGVGCDILTIGQYLQPNKRSVQVAAFHEPQVFDDLRAEALAMGFRSVSAGPLVRSSYHAAEAAMFGA